MRRAPPFHQFRPPSWPWACPPHHFPVRLAQVVRGVRLPWWASLLGWCHRRKGQSPRRMEHQPQVLEEEQLLRREARMPAEAEDLLMLES